MVQLLEKNLVVPNMDDMVCHIRILNPLCKKQFQVIPVMTGNDLLQGLWQADKQATKRDSCYYNFISGV